MPTYSELLPATRIHARRGFYWTPCPVGCPADGRLEITKGKKSTAYLVVETYPGAGYAAGRMFTLRKTDGITYHLFLADDRQHSTCDCPGHTYDATRKADARHGERSESLGCIHLDAVASLVWNRWLPESRENPDAVTGVTETQEQEPATCDACRGSGQLPGPRHDAYGPRPDYPDFVTCGHCGSAGSVTDDHKGGQADDEMPECFRGCGPSREGCPF